MVGVCDAQNPASIMLQCGKLGLAQSRIVVSETTLSQGGNLCERLIVTTAMKDLQIVAERAGRNQAVRRRSDSESRAPGGSKERDRFFKNSKRHGVLHDRQAEHGLARRPKWRLVAEPLKNFLDNRQAGDDLLEFHVGFKVQRTGPSEDLYPHRCINEHHRRLHHPLPTAPIRTHFVQISLP